MRAVGWLFVGLAVAFGVAVLSFDIAVNLDPIRSVVLAGGAFLVVAAHLFFVDDHRRKKRVRPL
jgi:hypothetical protein